MFKITPLCFLIIFAIPLLTITSKIFPSLTYKDQQFLFYKYDHTVGAKFKQHKKIFLINYLATICDKLKSVIPTIWTVKSASNGSHLISIVEMSHNDTE